MLMNRIFFYFIYEILINVCVSQNNFVISDCSEEAVMTPIFPERLNVNIPDKSDYTDTERILPVEDYESYDFNNGEYLSTDGAKRLSLQNDVSKYPTIIMTTLPETQANDEVVKYGKYTHLTFGIIGALAIGIGNFIIVAGRKWYRNNIKIEENDLSNLEEQNSQDDDLILNTEPQDIDEVPIAQLC